MSDIKNSQVYDNEKNKVSSVEDGNEDTTLKVGFEEVGFETVEHEGQVVEAQADVSDVASDTLTSESDNSNKDESDWQGLAEGNTPVACADTESVGEDISSEYDSGSCDDAPPQPEDSIAPTKRCKRSYSKKSSGVTTEEDDLPKMFSTSAGIKGDYYGTYYQKHDSDEFAFKPLGGAIKLADVIKNISDNTYEYEVEFKVGSETIKERIKKEDAMNPRTIQTLCKYGADIPQKNVNVVIDTLRVQEAMRFINKQGCSYVHTDLGWQKYYIEGQKSPEYMFKSTETIGDNLPTRSQYVGCMDVSRKGTFDAWKKMVEDHVLGHAALETILIASLASVVVGMIGDVTTGECPILHFADASSCGKTTAAMLAASVGGSPFHGRSKNPNTGKIQHSLLQSWGGTVNALLGMQRGNMGFPIILDELSKVGGKVDLTTLVYNFSEGTDISRMNQEFNVVANEKFGTSIVSFGEESLLDKCKSKNDGLRLRVFEVSGTLTEDAKHSRTLKKLCRQNYGFALDELARHIINTGGKKKVWNLYRKAIRDLSDLVPVCHSVDRFFEKFYAIYLTTGYLAREAFGMKFHLRKVFNFLNENLEKRIEKGNSSESAYERLLEKYRANSRHIFFPNKSFANNLECWGAYHEVSYVADNGQKVIGEYSIRKNLFAEQLRRLGFENKETILKDFKMRGYLNYESGRDTRRRKIGSGTAELCYVIRVFEVEVSEDDLHEEIKPSLQVTKTQSGSCYTSSGKRESKTLESKQLKALLN